MHFFPSQNTGAKDTKLNININPVLETSVNYTPIQIEPDGYLHGTDINLNVSSNHKAGFITTMSTIYNAAEENATSLINEAGTDSIVTLANDEIASGSFTSNSWGYSLSSGSTYNSIRAKDATPDTIFETEKASDSGHEVIRVGIKVDSSKASGIYSNTLLFTTVPNYYPITLKDIQYMQEVTPEICAATPETAAGDEQYLLDDIRDNKTYFVAKLADGNCWMTQNLDYDLDSTVALTPEDSDVKSNWTPVRSTSAKVADWQNDNNTPYSFNPGNYYADGTYFESAACDYLTTTCDHFAKTPYELNGEHGHVGNYYNWSAAVASNDTSATTTAGTDMESSICPKGWRLPYGRDSARDNDFATLNLAYENITDSDSNFLATPLFFIRTGTFHTGTLYHTSFYGFYWSSTVTSTTNADSLYFKSDQKHLNGGNDRLYGFNVRCIARKEPKTLTLKDAKTGTPIATYNFEKAYRLPAIPAKQYFTSIGWSEDENATTATYVAGDIISESKTLYAIYERPVLNMQEVAS